MTGPTEWSVLIAGTIFNVNDVKGNEYEAGISFFCSRYRFNCIV